MGLIDDKWKILIIRDLLTNNLRDMEKSGLVHREVFAEVPPRVEYSLTDTGWSLKPVLDSMVHYKSTPFYTNYNKVNKKVNAITQQNQQ